MSGRRIDDHSSPWGMKGKDSVFPDGPHKVKNESSASSAGEVTKYEDTTEAIKAQQNAGVSKIKGHPMKSGFRY